MGHDGATTVKVWLEFSYPQWAKAVKSAARRGLDVKAFIAEAASEEPLSVKMVRTDWLVTRLQMIAEVIPQVGEARTRIEDLIEALS